MKIFQTIIKGKHLNQANISKLRSKSKSNQITIELPIFIEEHNDPNVRRGLRDLTDEIRSRNRNHRSKSHHSRGFPHLRQPFFPANQKTTRFNRAIKINLKLESTPIDSGRHEPIFLKESVIIELKIVLKVFELFRGSLVDPRLGFGLKVRIVGGRERSGLERSGLWREIAEAALDIVPLRAGSLDVLVDEVVVRHC